MKDSRQSATEVIEYFDEWLGLPRYEYFGTVHLFSLRLPPEMLTKAAFIAMDKIPKGHVDGFKYFCGVCHQMIRDREEWLVSN